MSMLFLSIWTLAFFAMRFLPPRPRFRRLGRQPGFVACSAATLAIAFHVVGLVTVSYGVVDPVGRGLIPLPRYFFEEFSGVVPYAVAGAWLTLALSGKWRAPADSVDRIGIAL